MRSMIYLNPTVLTMRSLKDNNGWVIEEHLWLSLICIAQQSSVSLGGLIPFSFGVLTSEFSEKIFIHRQVSSRNCPWQWPSTSYRIYSPPFDSAESARRKGIIRASRPWLNAAKLRASSIRWVTFHCLIPNFQVGNWRSSKWNFKLVKSDQIVELLLSCCSSQSL